MCYQEPVPWVTPCPMSIGAGSGLSREGFSAYSTGLGPMAAVLFLSTAHTDADADRLLSLVEEFARSL